MIETDTSRKNNFGFLRLLFATLVILAHSPEMLDGNRHREILTGLFGTMSFGDLGVDGFFLISGYLITKSFTERLSTSSYVRKRVLRIFPGYVVCVIACVFVLAPCVGAGRTVLSWQTLAPVLSQVALLQPPVIPLVFVGLPCPDLNLSMWTIGFEFQCYLIAAVLGLLGLYSFRSRSVLLFAVAACLIVFGTGVISKVGPSAALWLSPTVRFWGVFGVGSVYFVFRDRMTFTNRGAQFAAVILTPLMFHWHLAEPAFAVFGGYLIFWFAFRVPPLSVSRFDNKVDISYGVYLYAWPVQNLIIWNDRTIEPWLLFTMTLPITSVLAYLSWRLVEKPALRLASASTSPEATGLARLRRRDLPRSVETL